MRLVYTEEVFSYKKEHGSEVSQIPHSKPKVQKYSLILAIF